MQPVNDPINLLCKCYSWIASYILSTIVKSFMTFVHKRYLF